ncbi:MAG: IS630 family transposase [Alphaproteobacteria bacterium]|nr:IS630 family transposase [Alphaproteobacteria bacterium]MDP6832457.1 IS630 family transposase [Alphaproteobacteria bacterium]MDP6876871.1 IS630 family transposase [Alphaproteobacteria bacterium]
MGAAIALRADYEADDLRRLAKTSKDADQSRRLLALAMIYDGGKRKDAARIGDVGPQVIRDWVLRFNGNGPAGLIDAKAPGKLPKLDDSQRQALAEIVEAGPIPAIHGVVRWRLSDLRRWIWQEFGISMDETTVSRELKGMNFVKLTARPRHHAQNELLLDEFKKNFPARVAEIRAKLPADTEIELWWQDEARIGQKNGITRRWAKRGTRPRAPKDQRTKSAYIFGAICPARGVGAALVLPRCNTQAMQWHLDEISSQVTEGAHAILILDQAGWHTTDKLSVPCNITLLPLPPRSPELNPVENIWQFMRDNWISNRVFKSHDEIVAISSEAWNKLIDQPWRILSIGLRDWAHGF